MFRKHLLILQQPKISTLCTSNQSNFTTSYLKIVLASIPKRQFNIRHISKENSLCFTLVANIELRIHILQEKSNLRSKCKFKFAFSSEIQIENIKEAASGLLFCLISAHFGKFILHSMRSYVRTKLMHIILLEACHFKYCLSRK